MGGDPTAQGVAQFAGGLAGGLAPSAIERALPGGAKPRPWFRWTCSVLLSRHSPYRSATVCSGHSGGHRQRPTAIRVSEFHRLRRCVTSRSDLAGPEAQQNASQAARQTVQRLSNLQDELTAARQGLPYSPPAASALPGSGGGGVSGGVGDAGGTGGGRGAGSISPGGDAGAGAPGGPGTPGAGTPDADNPVTMGERVRAYHVANAIGGAATVTKVALTSAWARPGRSRRGVRRTSRAA